MIIKIEELKENLANKNTKELYIELKGMITMKISIKNSNIEITEDAITIYNKEDLEESIKLNIHQIMKIEKISQNIFDIQFDYLQNAIITVAN